MPTIDEARESIYQRFVTQWADFTEFTFRNESFDPPNGSWVRLNVSHRDSNPSTLGETGNRKFTRSAAIIVQVFSDTELGSQTLDRISNRVSDIFEGVSFSGISTFSTTIRELPTEGRWSRSVVETEFFYDEIK